MTQSQPTDLRVRQRKRKPEETTTLLVEEDGLDILPIRVMEKQQQETPRLKRQTCPPPTTIIGQLCWYGCSCCLLTLLVISVVVVYGHQVTCLFHKAFCTPLTEYIYRFPMLPSALPKEESVLVTGGRTKTQTHPSESQRCDRFADFLSRRPQHSSNSNNNKLLFLIGESRGGSTYTYSTLNLHPQIEMIGGEPLFDFSNHVCNNNPLLRDTTECTFDHWLETLYTNTFDQRPTFLSKNKGAGGAPIRLLGTKINIEQIPPAFYADVADFFYCIRHSSVVVQVTRAASIASFLNYQSEVPERLYSADWRFTGGTVPQALSSPLTLDPQLAADWVHQRDSLSHELFARLSFSVRIQYTRVYYEQLVVGGDFDFCDYHWKSLFAFLGVDASRSGKELRTKLLLVSKNQRQRKTDLRTLNKTHGNLPCYQRIANWEEVRTALNGSLSVVACEMFS